MFSRQRSMVSKTPMIKNVRNSSFIIEKIDFDSERIDMELNSLIIDENNITYFLHNANSYLKKEMELNE